MDCMGRGDLSPHESNAFFLALQGCTDTEEQKLVKKEELEMHMYHARFDINSAPLRSGRYQVNRAVCQQNPFILRTLFAHPEIDVTVESRKNFPLSNLQQR